MDLLSIYYLYNIFINISTYTYNIILYKSCSLHYIYTTPFASEALMPMVVK